MRLNAYLYHTNSLKNLPIQNKTCPNQFRSIPIRFILCQSYKKNKSFTFLTHQNVKKIKDFLYLYHCKGFLHKREAKNALPTRYR